MKLFAGRLFAGWLFAPKLFRGAITTQPFEPDNAFTFGAGDKTEQRILRNNNQIMLMLSAFLSTRAD